MNKHDVAKILENIATLLELQGENPFKVRAYLRAARTIEGLDEDIAVVVKNEKLEELPGIGASIAHSITELVQTGTLAFYEEMKKQIPGGAVELLKVPGLGAKRVKVLYEELGIKSKEDLIAACRSGLIATLPGFTEKSQKRILTSITKVKKYTQGHLWFEAMRDAEPILAGLRALPEVKHAEIAGSVRRKVEVIGDLDFVVSSSRPQVVLDWFTTQPFVARVIAKGKSKSSVRLWSGFQAEVRVVPPKSYACTLIYFTGSKEHNITLRKRANDLGYSLSEYGLSGYTKSLRSEESVYNALDLAYIPPELRENMGEVEAASARELPHLVDERDLKGAFHCHTTESDGHNSLLEMVKAAENMGWEYIGIADHSKASYQANGLDEERLCAQIEAIKKLRKKTKTYIFTGTECDILKDGTLDFSDDILKQLDYVVVSVHRSFQLDEKSMTARLIKAIENPYSTIVGHPTGRLLLRRNPYAVDLTKVIDACIANGKIIEINASPYRLDMDWRYWHKAKEKGLKCAINPDAHSTKELRYVQLGVQCARKGWLESSDIINTMPLSTLCNYLRHRIRDMR